jgi:hypothetical protein
MTETHDKKEMKFQKNPMGKIHYENPAQPHPLLMNELVDGGNVLLVRLYSIVMHSRRWYQAWEGDLSLTLGRRRKAKSGKSEEGDWDFFFVEWSGGVYDFILLYFIVADSTIQAGRSMC